MPTGSFCPLHRQDALTPRHCSREFNWHETGHMGESGILLKSVFLFLDVLLDRYTILKIDTLFSYLLSILFTWYPSKPFFSECLRLAILVSSANLLAMYSFRSHSRNAESESASNQILQVILFTMQSEKHISGITVHLCFSHYVEFLNFYCRTFNGPMILFLVSEYYFL